MANSAALITKGNEFKKKKNKGKSSPGSRHEVMRGWDKLRVWCVTSPLDGTLSTDECVPAAPGPGPSARIPLSWPLGLIRKKRFPDPYYNATCCIRRAHGLMACLMGLVSRATPHTSGS